jgi:hypothetical protein
MRGYSYLELVSLSNTFVSMLIKRMGTVQLELRSPIGPECRHLSERQGVCLLHCPRRCSRLATQSEE